MIGYESLVCVDARLVELVKYPAALRAGEAEAFIADMKNKVREDGRVWDDSLLKREDHGIRDGMYVERITYLYPPATP